MQFIDLKSQYDKLKNEITQNITNVLDSGQYMLGDYVTELEEKLAKYVGVNYCVTCANGTDALSLALMAWDIKVGDAVFVPSFTFYSTAEVVSLIGATPIFVDSEPLTYNICPKALDRAIRNVIEDGKLTPKVIIPVDLFGLPAEYEAIIEIAKKYNLKILEDAAQGFGGSINGKFAGSFGEIATTSFFPAKPLGCYGDGGALFTDSKEISDHLKSLRVHGKGKFKYDNIRVGMNSRLDTIQAAILLPKLNAFENFELEARNKFAKMYTEKLEEYVTVPYVPNGMRSSWAQYTIQLKSKDERTVLQESLARKEIPTMIYYPKPLHKQSVYSDYKFDLENLAISEKLSDIVLSLPMHPYLSEDVVEFICENIIIILEDFRNEKR